MFPFSHTCYLFASNSLATRIRTKVYNRVIVVIYKELTYNRETITDNGIEVVNREQKCPEERYCLFVMLDFVKCDIKRITERDVEKCK